MWSNLNLSMNLNWDFGSNNSRSLFVFVFTILNFDDSIRNKILDFMLMIIFREQLIWNFECGRRWQVGGRKPNEIMVAHIHNKTYEYVKFSCELVLYFLFVKKHFETMKC